LIVDHWVMSCRAFSRMIEHHVMQAIFERYGVDAIQLRFQPTPKNQPLQEFLSQLSPLPEAGGMVTITSTAWRGAGFTLPHATEEFDPAYE
jgi:predicted enzyme involved in methoxymalonyl-ACP biosynthesis